MAVPKRKTSKSRRNMRRAHDGLTPVGVVVDRHTGEYRLPHRINPKDGMYKGKQVIKIKQKKEDS